MAQAYRVDESRIAAGGEHGVVTTTHPLASQVGLEMLRRGGSAVDAAVAASFVLGVVEPFMSGIGGGCFVVHHDGTSGEVVAIDSRGVAPAAATEDMFVKDGQVQYDDAAIGARSVLVPGHVAGLGEVHGAYGRLPLAELVEPGARIAEAGYLASPMFAYQARSTAHTLPALRRDAAATAIYLAGGEAPAAGTRLANPDLARTYRRLGADGTGAFYTGEIAAAIAATMRKGGGLITEEDLARFRPRRQQPVRGRYRDYDLISVAPPSSGGIFLVQCLNVLSGLGLPVRARYDVATLHLLAETMKLAYADRAHFVGDPRFVDMPVTGMTSLPYADALRARIDPVAAGRGVGHGDPWTFDQPGRHTTHLCAADRDGNVVAITQTVGSAMGSGVVVPGTGVLLNHLMGDFSPMVGAQTVHGWGTFTSAANAIAPGKTPTSSNVPVIVLHGGRPVLATGAAGGSRIPSTVLQVVLNVLDYGMDVQTALAAARIHDQGEGLEVEKEIPEAVAEDLAARGH
ncbi:MAG: gamma-glutamyltransferase, partial [Chloroflexota bacterium]